MADVIFGSTKTYKAVVSTAFRQWRAESHCRWLHGYSIEFGVKFEADYLDHRNWVVDFGGLKAFKQWLEVMFDHTTVVAADDPMLPTFKHMHERDMINLRVVEAVGCEQFAHMAYRWLDAWIKENGLGQRVRVVEVECREQHANSAYVRRKDM